jgi:hypothetical protein
VFDSEHWKECETQPGQFSGGSSEVLSTNAKKIATTTMPDRNLFKLFKQW